MSIASIVAFGAVSALGEGEQAYSAGTVGEGARVAIARDEELARAGLGRPLAARAPLASTEEDRATTILKRALALCATDLDRVRPAWRRERVGLAIGTSSGGMRSAERLFAGDATMAAHATYFAPLSAATSSLRLAFAPATLVLGACAAGAIAIGLGARWLREGACDLVLAGGFDAVSVFVAAGFEVLRATTGNAPPRPFRVGRDGMVLGEAAAVLALAPPGDPRARAYVAGFGASADAVHLTAPDRTGDGLARAAEAALREAGLAGSAVDIVSAHATATPFNDAAEARAIARVVGDRAVVHPFKAQVGHTLGAAGALESLVCIDALERGILPAAAGDGELDPDAAVRLLDAARAGTPRVALKLSAAFGGANAALVLTREPTSARARAPREAYLAGAAHVDGEVDAPALARAIGWAPDRLARCDRLCRIALRAVAKLADTPGGLAGAGIVVGQSLATIETNLLFHRRIAERGVKMAEPRRFAYTSPNAVAGEVSVAFGLTGPSFAVGAGLSAGVEALGIAATLVRGGDADRIVVVAVDEVGEAVALQAADASGLEAGAVAALVTAEPAGARARLGQGVFRLGPDAPRTPRLAGHRALLPLTSAPLPDAVEAACPLPEPGQPGWGAFARVELLL
jgi:3-oxoacyl-[acyl-carrier-protein] synthase II